MFRRIRIRARPASFCSYHTPSIFPKNTPSSFSFQTVAIMSLFIPGSYADRPHNALAGYGKTLWAHWNFIALHIWGNRSIRRQDAKKSRQHRSRIVRPSTGTRPPHHSAARTDLVLLIRRTVRQRVRLGPSLAAALLDGIFEHPAGLA